MRFNINGFAVIACIGFLSIFTAPKAYATVELKLSDGLGHTVDVLDGSAGDSCAAVNCVTFNGGLGDWDINVTTGTDKTASAPSYMDLNSVDHHAASAVASTLTMLFSDDGFTPASPGFSTKIGGTLDPGGTLTASLFGGNTNTKFDMSQQIGSTLTFTTDPFSGTDGGPVTVGVNPFSLTQQVTITFGTAAGQASFDYKVSPVPEPTSVALFGGALLFIGSAIRRKVRRA